MKLRVAESAAVEQPPKLSFGVRLITPATREHVQVSPPATVELMVALFRACAKRSCTLTLALSRNRAGEGQNRSHTSNSPVVFRSIVDLVIEPEATPCSVKHLGRPCA
jgi:hypothetical protein